MRPALATETESVSSGARHSLLALSPLALSRPGMAVVEMFMDVDVLNSWVTIPSWYPVTKALD